MTDNVITAGQMLLKAAKPEIRGLQDTILGETLAFDIARSEFVQVLNVSKNHWITVSNIGCQKGHIDVFDSLPSTISTRTKQQIAAICFSDKSSITVHISSVQRQYGGNDCGLFSLAFATSLCFGEEPSKTCYHQDQLRSHLLHCLEKRVMTPFPKNAGRKRQQRKAEIANFQFNIYCYCRQPEDEDPMIQCERCNEWFHKDCINAPAKVWKKKNEPWTCKNCCE